MTEDRESYYLCSQEVITRMSPAEVSKPFRSGYVDDTEQYYVAVLNTRDMFDYFDAVVIPNNSDPDKERIDFWTRECVSGSMDVSKITIASARRKGLFREIEDKTLLTTERNIAMVIHNVATKYRITPIEFINRIAK